MRKGKLNALIGLLDDPDQTIIEMVEKELLKETDAIIPVLEQKWECSFDGRCQGLGHRTAVGGIFWKRLQTL